ncbi:MAG: hypothetical protein AUH85_12690 [Chloroflexi bacterium 13_1_40CM_4_68_4]|nr:MAG: hypothetical protein AUH85_12690 [Chloroflexi bacterium 13_1_40CM_4_68_4]
MFRDNKKRGDAPAPFEVHEPVSPAHEERTTTMTTLRDSATQENVNALLGKGIEFEGKLSFEGTVRIDGKFTGQITTGDVLIIGEGARVQAEINCGSVIVRGELTGNIKAKTGVELHNPARVKGDIWAPSLMIEKGVTFQGQCKMENLDKELSRYEPATGKHTLRSNGPTPATTEVGAS